MYMILIPILGAFQPIQVPSLSPPASNRPVIYPIYLEIPLFLDRKYVQIEKRVFLLYLISSRATTLYYSSLPVAITNLTAARHPSLVFRVLFKPLCRQRARYRPLSLSHCLYSNRKWCVVSSFSLQKGQILLLTLGTLQRNRKLYRPIFWLRSQIVIELISLALSLQSLKVFQSKIRFRVYIALPFMLLVHLYIHFLRECLSRTLFS